MVSKKARSSAAVEDEKADVREKMPPTKSLPRRKAPVKFSKRAGWRSLKRCSATLISR